MALGTGDNSHGTLTAGSTGLRRVFVLCAGRYVMSGVNPYRLVDVQGHSAKPTVKPRHKLRRTMIGFFFGAALPVGFGVYGMHQHSAYVASLGPNEAVCGMGAFASFMMIFVVGPFCGMIGAASGWVSAAIGGASSG